MRILNIKILVLIAFTFSSYNFNSKKVKFIELDITENEMVKLKGDKYYYKDSIYTVEDFFISKFETTNVYYNEFLKDIIKNKDTLKYRLCIRDSSLWNKSIFEMFGELYHKHPNYTNFPVVTISFDAANTFCEWLTNKYNTNPKRKYSKVKFYLPNEIEWLIAANYGFDFTGIQKCILRDEGSYFSWETKSVYNTKGELFANLNIAEEYIIKHKNEPIFGVNTFDRNKNGLFCIHGNVAEMLKT